MQKTALALTVEADLADTVDPLDLKSSFSPSSLLTLLEESLEQALPLAEEHPQLLHRGMRYAVFAGGKRLRGQLLLQAAHAGGATQSAWKLALRMACAIELLHAASLVHDDLPCFDDAKERRGRPTVHLKFGEAMAVLVGDALLSRAFELLADAPPELSGRALRLLRLLGRATGSTSGIIGGQSMEQREPGSTNRSGSFFSPELFERYHQMKTAALFQLSAEAAAVIVGAANPAPWAELGQLIGRWFQLADDWLDVKGEAKVLGKPVGRDTALGRPNAVLSRGEAQVSAEMQALFDATRERVLALAAAPELLIEFLCTVQGYLFGTSRGGPARASKER